MPISAYDEDTFVKAAGTFMPMVLVLSLLYPTAQMVANIVHEKEGRIREGMLIMGLGSGYHRDLQTTKKAFVEAVDLATSTLELLIVVIPELQIREDRLQGAMSEELFVTDEVYKKVAAGQPFREAYADAKKEFFERKAKRDDA